MIINVIDPALRLTAGHHLDLGLGVLRELQRSGHDVHVYCNAGITPAAAEILGRHAAFTPQFRLTPYDDQSTLQAASDRNAAFTALAHSVADDLRGLRRADAWFWPSLFASQAYACALVRPGVPVCGNVHVEPRYIGADGDALWAMAFQTAHANGVRLRVGAFEPMLCEQYRPLTADGDFRLLPIPYDRSGSAAVRERLEWIGFFGAQRDEKGVYLIEQLIPQLLERCKIVLHDSSGGSSGSGNERFRMLFGYVEDLAAEIGGCDLIVTPYDPVAYRTKGSAIVWSALANGVPVVTPGNTASGTLIEQSGAGATFETYSAASVMAAINAVASNYPSVAQHARDAGERWGRENGNRQYVAAMLAALA